MTRSTSPARIPSLDGLRAISIAAVLLGHLAGSHGFPDRLSSVVRNPVVDVANFGVRVFFVISGFLITGLLMAEREKRGKIHLGAFYLRRVFRIMPAYVALIAVVALLDASGAIQVPTSDFVAAWTYRMNYHLGGSWELGHLWSLAVEEQFYFLWPLTLLLAGLASGRRIAIAVMCIAPMVRVLELMFGSPALQPTIGWTFETAADTIAAG